MISLPSEWLLHFCDLRRDYKQWSHRKFMEKLKAENVGVRDERYQWQPREREESGRAKRTAGGGKTNKKRRKK